jgi:putative NADPH-quinone reductase
MASAEHKRKRVLVVNGSYRAGGVTDQVIAAALQQLPDVDTDVVNLRDYPIEFCLNCRECMQHPGINPGPCVIDDSMAALVERIEAADAYILAAPTNLGSVTALFKRFMERLAVYLLWPWGKHAPRYRKAGQVPKKAMLISSSAAPAFFGRWMYGSPGQLRMTAKVIGAKPIGQVFCGLAGIDENSSLPSKTIARAEKLAQRLLAE